MKQLKGYLKKVVATNTKHELAAQDILDAIEILGRSILKNQFEVYNPLRKEVVDVNKIIEAFKNAGVDIENKITF